MPFTVSAESQEVLDRMIGAVDLDNWDVDEYNLLGSIMVRAGVAWRCIDPQCNCINHLTSRKCDNCNARRPKEREAAEPEDMLRLSFEYDRRKRKKMREAESLQQTEENIE